MFFAYFFLLLVVYHANTVRPPRTCAATYIRNLRILLSPFISIIELTAGLKCPPEILPKL